IAVLDMSTGTADHVMVVVMSVPLKPRRMSGRLDLPDQISVDQGGQDVIHGLLGQRTQTFTNALMNLLRSGVRVIGQPLKHRMARCGYPQAMGAKFGRSRCVVSSHSATIIDHIIE